MSAMNTVAIVNEFAGNVPQDEVRIKARMADLIRTTVKASVGVTVPAGMEPTDHYDVLRGAPVRMAPVGLDIDHNKPINERLSDAATVLFESYD